VLIQLRQSSASLLKVPPNMAALVYTASIKSGRWVWRAVSASWRPPRRATPKCADSGCRAPDIDKMPAPAGRHGLDVLLAVQLPHDPGRNGHWLVEGCALHAGAGRV
jgi:hypothetical protein